jgi:hypothetical protein
MGDPTMGGMPPPGPQIDPQLAAAIQPTVDPQIIAQMMGMLEQGDQQAHTALDQAQQAGKHGAVDLIQMMRDMGNPAAQAAVTTPGYPTPPPPAGNY